MIELKERVDTITISKYDKVSVIMYNDDTTSMEFVVAILKQIFHKHIDEAQRLMLDAHENGSTLVGKYGKKSALSKVKLSLRKAKEYGFNEFRLEIEE